MLLSIQYDSPAAFELYEPVLLPAGELTDSSNSSALQFDTESETLDFFLACQQKARPCSVIVTAVTGIYLSAYLGLDMHFFEEQGGAAGFAEAVASHLNISTALVQVVNPSRASSELTGRCVVFLEGDFPAEYLV